MDAELARGSWRLFRADADTLFQAQSGTLWEKFIGSGTQIMVQQPGDKGSAARLHVASGDAGAPRKQACEDAGAPRGEAVGRMSGA